MTTIAKVLMMIASPIVGLDVRVRRAEHAGERRQRRRRTRTTPLTRRRVSMPNARVSSGFSVAARMRAPSARAFDHDVDDRAHDRHTTITNSR
jgi:hypothetical protein